MTDAADLGMTTKEILTELRDDMRTVKETIGSMALEQARLADSIRQEQDLGAERRVTMRRTADSVIETLGKHGERIEKLERRNDRQDGAAIFAKAAFGTSALALVAVILNIADRLP